MVDELVHMENQIRTSEDVLLRCKNASKAEIIRAELMLMRAKLQKMKYQKQRSES